MTSAEFVAECRRQQESKSATAQADPPTEALAAKAQVIKLGIDVHLDRYVVVRQFWRRDFLC